MRAERLVAAPGRGPPAVDATGFRPDPQDGSRRAAETHDGAAAVRVVGRIDEFQHDFGGRKGRAVQGETAGFPHPAV